MNDTNLELGAAAQTLNAIKQAEGVAALTPVARQVFVAVLRELLGVRVHIGSKKVDNG